MDTKHIADVKPSEEYGNEVFRTLCKALAVSVYSKDLATCPDCLKAAGETEKAAMYELAKTDLGEERPRTPAFPSFATFVEQLYPRETITLNKLRVAIDRYAAY